MTAAVALADSLGLSVDLRESADVYVRNALQYATIGESMIEVAVPIGELTGEQDAKGTADQIVYAAAMRRLIVHDYKSGRVAVDPENNEQLMLYALGAMRHLNIHPDELDDVVLAITQPQVSHAPQEWVCNTQTLIDFSVKVQESAFAHAAGISDATPTEAGCKYCVKRSTCSALAAFVSETTAIDTVADFTEAPEANDAAAILMQKYAAIPLIEAWIKAVTDEAYALALSGGETPGYKLVQGRNSARKWIDAAAVESVMKSMRVKADDMYDKSIISPTAAEKLAKADVIGARQWPKLLELIVEPKPGAPALVPSSAKGKPYVIASVADELAQLAGPAAAQPALNTTKQENTTASELAELIG